ncbi:MAG: hypothetical protein N2558_01935 [Patescibacteria group bacterium]|nr:hypothetical protein [Patescibacteria group bacterium]
MPSQEKTNSSTNEKDSEPIKKNKSEEVEIFSWEGPNIPVVKYNKEFWLSAVVIGGIISLILYITEGIIPVILIIALGFFYFVLSSVKPETLKFSITNKGIKIQENLIEWNYLYRYWFSYWMGNTILVFQTSRFGGRLEIVINKDDKNKIRQALSDYVYEEQNTPSNIDKLATWFSENIDRKKAKLQQNNQELANKANK